MKNICKNSLPFMVALAATFVFTACNQQSKQDQDNVTKEDVKSEVQEAASTTKAYLSEEKEGMVENYQQRLEKIEDQIKAFKGEMENASETVTESYQASVDQLESRYATVENNINDLKNSTEDAWGELKDGVDDAISDLEESLKNAKEEFNQESS